MLKWIAHPRGPSVLVAGFVLPLVLAALLVPFRTDFADAAASLVLIAGVTLVAIVGTRTAGYVASVSASLWFDFFLTRPYEQLTINHAPDVEITVSLFLVGVMITELAARNRHHQADALEESSYVGLLYKVSELVAMGRSADQVIDGVREALIELLQLRDCRFERGRDFERTKELGRDGRVFLGGLNWPVNDWGLPGPEIALPVLSRGRVVGRFVLSPTIGEGVSLRRRLVAIAVADQVGSLLVRHLDVA